VGTTTGAVGLADDSSGARHVDSAEVVTVGDSEEDLGETTREGSRRALPCVMRTRLLAAAAGFRGVSGPAWWGTTGAESAVMGERTTRAPEDVLELASVLVVVLCPPRERR